MPLGKLATKIREAKTPSVLGAENKTELSLQEKINADDNIPSEVKTIDDLFESEREEFEVMNIDPSELTR